MHQNPATYPGGMLKTVAAVVIDQVAPFEFGVLCEVFGIDRTEDGVPPCEFRVCGERPGVPLRATVGVQMTPAYGLDGLDGADLAALVDERSVQPLRTAPELLPSS